MEGTSGLISKVGSENQRERVLRLEAHTETKAQSSFGGMTCCNLTPRPNEFFSVDSWVYYCLGILTKSQDAHHVHSHSSVARQRQPGTEV